MGVILLFVAQLALTLSGLAYLWRRLEKTRAELDDVRSALEALESGSSRMVRPQRAAPASTIATAHSDVVVEMPAARAARAWSVGPRQSRLRKLPPLSDDVRIGIALGLAAVAPAFAFVFGAPAGPAMATGIVIAAAMMVLALRPAWRAAAWAGVATGAVWVLLGFALQAATEHAALFAAAMVAAGAAGCVYAYKRQIAPGAALAAVMAAASLLIGVQGEMIGPAGAAFAGVTLSAAVIGAANLRVESFHVAAFLAALIGLYVLSGQEAAAIWFTPAAGLAGAAFFAIAVIRVPQLGARGVTLAGTGALGPLAMVATLNAAGHGLADQYASGGAYLLLAVLFAGLIAIAARRREGRLAALGAVVWVLALAASLAAALGVLAEAPTPVVSTSFACLALMFVMLDDRLPHAAWRTMSLTFGIASAYFAATSAHAVLSESTGWPAGAVVAAAIAAPAALLGTASWRALRGNAYVFGGVFEFLAGALGVVAANLAIRLVFTDGAIKLHPLDFVEAGMHIAVWLTAALVLAIKAKGQARAPRTGAAVALSAAAVGAILLAGVLWLTPYWSARSNPFDFPQPLGFVAPALLFGAHWVLMRARGSHLRTRIALGASAFSFASAAALWVSSSGLPAWSAAILAAAAFASAIALNFAPGVVIYAPRGGVSRRRRSYAHRVREPLETA